MDRYRCGKCNGRLSIRKVLGYEVWDMLVDPITGDLERDGEGAVTVVGFEDASGESYTTEQIGIMCESGCCEISDEVGHELLDRHERTAREYEGQE